MTYQPRHARYDYKLATEVEVRPNGISIDGEEFPYHVAIEGPYVETCGGGMDYLWVPICVDVDRGGITLKDR